MSDEEEAERSLDPVGFLARVLSRTELRGQLVRAAIGVAALVGAVISAGYRQEYLVTMFCTVVGLAAGNGFIIKIRDRS